ncbi:MAG: RNA polymerase sigma factor [Gemmatimonadetes bacterium]|nr:RNA polymerase sigma factor [Gemmatimonadota bacterium]MCY3677139.1 RNA polymerase sigma factor [Gemmatimonadota bacterium]
MTDTTFGVPDPLSGGEAPPRKEPRSSGGNDPPAAERDAMPTREKPRSSGDNDLSDTEHDPIDGVAFRDGDEKCFRAVLDRYESLIRMVVWSYADSDDERNDVYQEVCIRMLEKRAKYQERDSMGGWIRTVARHVAKNWRDARLARVAAHDEYATAVAPFEAARHITEDPSRLLNYKESLASSKRALDGLSDSQAEAFRLVQIEGYTAREAARELGSNRRTVRSNLRHARKKLREQLAELRDEMP